ncbi:MAG: nuclear transport factor 2 family protein [Pyrinomonadaceae bacterium]
MKKTILFLNIMTMSACLSVSAQAIKEERRTGVKTEYEKIDKVLELYVDGLRKGNVSLLQQAFFSEGQFCRLSNQNDVQCKKFAEELSEWVKIPEPNSSGKILSLELEGSMAKVTFKLNFGTTVFVDYLTMYKSKTNWKIVSKATWIHE